MNSLLDYQLGLKSVQQSNWEFLQDELACLRARLLRHALWLQTRSEHPDLAEAAFAQDDPRGRALTDEIESLTARCRKALAEGRLPIKHLVEAFGLNDFEMHILLLALTIELDASFEPLFARCHDDSNTSLPTVALALRLFCQSADEWTQGRLSFMPFSSLRHWGLLHLEAHAPSLLRTSFHLDQRIVNAILGVDHVPAELTGQLHFLRPLPPDQLIHPESVVRLGAIVQKVLASGQWPGRLVINLYGGRGSGRRTLAAALGEQMQIEVAAVNVSELAGENTLSLFMREAVLQRSVPYLDCSNLAEEGRRAVLQGCADGARLMLVGSINRAAWLEDQPQLTVIPFEIPALSSEDRRRLWSAQLGKGLDGQAELLAMQFPFSAGDIRLVSEAAGVLALLRAPEDPEVTAQDVWQAARDHPQHRLGELARRIEPHYTWEDIVLPDAAMQQLAEIQQQVAQQARVYGAWGFGKKLTRGRGVSALFSGSSGTGKTMAAEILASALKLDLYRIDLSSVVSKYIGETEKNLARVFDEAERSSVILFFDEADALFGKRSEVKDAHDRYANIEINYLLQRMEDYQGLAILATNMRQSLDEAFLRRLRFLIDFPFPDEGQRAEIWRRTLPPEMPRQDLNIDFLARQFKIAGGNIRNIVLNAAFLAAGEDSPLQMPHLIRATRREFDKIGRACLESDFGPYYSLVR
ncbi:MAG TPA: ATP-binding protein [Anaerolineales bacterium]|nr:ATP-binding protein [Anaerolineales bacterium]